MKLEYQAFLCLAYILCGQTSKVWQALQHALCSCSMRDAQSESLVMQE